MTRGEVRKRLKAKKNRGLMSLVASRLGINRATVSRWLAGKIKSKRIADEFVAVFEEQAQGAKHE